jgi:hypothetical protein
LAFNSEPLYLESCSETWILREILCHLAKYTARKDFEFYVAVWLTSIQKLTVPFASAAAAGGAESGRTVMTARSLTGGRSPRPHDESPGEFDGFAARLRCGRAGYQKPRFTDFEMGVSFSDRNMPETSPCGNCPSNRIPDRFTSSYSAGQISSNASGGRHFQWIEGDRQIWWSVHKDNDRIQCICPQRVGHFFHQRPIPSIMPAQIVIDKAQLGQISKPVHMQNQCLAT